MKLLSAQPIDTHKILGVIRIILGLLMIYHGKEVFDAELMKGYTEWDNFKSDSGKFLVYLGKGSEFVAGVLLTLGFLTRLGAVIMTGTLAYITFLVGHGHFWYEDQHPFMFVLFGVLYFFTGPGAWSVDAVAFKPKK